MNNYFKNLGNITTPFLGKTKDENQHKGVDFANRKGTIIPAFEDGKITVTGFKKDGTGNVVILKDKHGNVHQYSHLQQALVKPGTKIKKGVPIAKMGDTGNSYSPNGGSSDHLDIRIASKSGKWVNPLIYLKKT